MPEPIIWSEDYTGPRWTYGMTNRPPGISCQPDGRIIGADDAKARPDPRVLHGTIQYARPLKAREVASFELLPIDEHLAVYSMLSMIEIYRRLREEETRLV